MAYEKYYVHKKRLEKKIESANDPREVRAAKIGLKNLPANYVVRFGKDSVPPEEMNRQPEKTASAEEPDERVRQESELFLYRYHNGLIPDLDMSKYIKK